MAITGYPSQIVDALSKHNITLSRLPVLDLKERTSESGYIDFLKEPEMIFPLMQFTDIQGRKGLAFHLRGKVDTVVKVGSSDNKEKLSVSQLHPIITIFQLIKNGRLWVYGEGMGPKFFFMDNVYRAFHKPDHKEDACKTCPTMPVNKEELIAWTCKIIDGTDPVWAIDGKIEQA